MFLLVPAYPASPGKRAIKRLLLLLFLSFYAVSSLLRYPVPSSRHHLSYDDCLDDIITVLCCVVYNVTTAERVDGYVAVAVVYSPYLLFSATPLPSSRHRVSYDHCLDDKREDYRNCSVLCSV